MTLQKFQSVDELAFGNDRLPRSRYAAANLNIEGRYWYVS